MYEFERNGRCLVAGITVGAPAELGGCYIAHGGSKSNVWRAGSYAQPITSIMSGDLQIGCAGSCSANAVPEMASQGTLSWNRSTNQLVFQGTSAPALCAGDGGSKLVAMPCTSGRASGWNQKVVQLPPAPGASLI